jgi:hypothetical protein
MWVVRKGESRDDWLGIVWVDWTVSALVDEKVRMTVVVRVDRRGPKLVDLMV